VLFYDLQSAPDATTQHLPLHHEMQAHRGPCNGVAFHPYFSAQYPLLSTAGGARTFTVPPSNEDDSDSSDDGNVGGGGGSGGGSDGGGSANQRRILHAAPQDNSVALWSLGGPLEGQGIADALASESAV
jgi:hypothetical protein